jgi:hypothetical protein
MSTAPLLPLLQSIIERSYGMPRVIGDAARFLIGDEGLRRFYGEGEPGRARLMVRDERGGVHAALYLPDRLVRHLERHDPRRGLDDRNIDAFAVLVEELDHLLVLGSRASMGRTVRLLELEMHALVTKHLMVLHLLGRLTGRRRLSAFHRRWARHHLFEKFSQDAGEEPGRYREAARLAWRYVAWLDRLSADDRRAELPAFHLRTWDEQTRRVAAFN